MTTKSTQEVEQYLSTGDNIEFILQSCFHYVPARTRIIYEEGMPVEIEASEFWWRSCTLKEGYMQGEQGYLMVWLSDGDIITHHTYHYPPDI